MTLPPGQGDAETGGGGPAGTPVAFATTRVEVPPVSRPEDFALVRERDLHGRDMDYRRTQLAVAKFGIGGVGIMGAACVVLGIWTQDDKVFQFGTGIMTTILGLVLGFLFPRT